MKIQNFYDVFQLKKRKEKSQRAHGDVAVFDDNPPEPVTSTFVCPSFRAIEDLSGGANTGFTLRA